MFCVNCGAQLEENQKFCKDCGQPVQEGESTQGNVNGYVNNSNAPKQAKCWTVFAGVGLGLGIGGFSAFWIPFTGFLVSICGLVFSILGKKSVTANGKATAGLVLSIIGLTLGLIFTVSLISDMIDTINSFVI